MSQGELNAGTIEWRFYRMARRWFPRRSRISETVSCSFRRGVTFLLIVRKVGQSRGRGAATRASRFKIEIRLNDQR